MSPAWELFHPSAVTKISRRSGEIRTHDQLRMKKLHLPPCSAALDGVADGTCTRCIQLHKLAHHYVWLDHSPRPENRTLFRCLVRAVLAIELDAVECVPSDSN